MKGKASVFLFILLLCVFLSFTGFGAGEAASEAGKTGACVVDMSLCLDCHGREEMETRYGDLSRACDAACFKCHKGMEGHHKTGMAVDFKVPGRIRLVSENRVGCITCHDLTVERYCDRCRKAQSLFARVFSAKKQHKSYYLVMDNRKGQLCKKCH